MKVVYFNKKIRLLFWMRRNPPLSSETASLSNGGSSKTPSTPTSASLDTPSIPRKNIFRPNFINTPESPMFTTADKERIHKQKSDYQVEIAALTQRRNQLHVELKKTKANIVSQGELTFLKAETRNQASSSNSEEIKDLMNTFIETVRDISACQAQCSILEQRIREEAQHREQIVNESQEITSCLDFSELLPLSIKLPQNDYQSYNEKDKLEISRAQQKIKDIHSELTECEIATQVPNPKFKESALEIARSSEYQWQLKSVGTMTLRNEIQRLQRSVATSDSEIKKLQELIQNEQKKLSDIQIQQHKEEAEALSRFSHGKEEFAKNIQITDDEIKQIELKIQRASQSYDTIMDDLKKIDSQKNIFNFGDFNEDESNENYSNDNSNNNSNYIDNNQEDQQIIYDELIKKKNDICKEIDTLKLQVNKVKKKAKLKEQKFLTEIKKLKSKYQSYQLAMQKSCIQMNQLDSSSVTGEIQSLIDKIDNSLTELHSVINQ